MQINFTFLFLAIVAFASCITCADSATPCTSCGEECVDVCGTRYFRFCCFNYLRKKRSTSAMDAKPELWISKSLLNKFIKLAQLGESDRISIPQPLQICNQFSESKPDGEGQGAQGGQE